MSIVSTSELPRTDLTFELFLAQTARWPSSGRHILAQFDDASIVVYQAYRRSIGTWPSQLKRLAVDRTEGEPWVGWTQQ